MTVTCPSGHTSDDADYCSVCGVKINGNGTPAAAPSTPSAPADPVADTTDAAAPASGGTCPNCASELDAGSRFCEVCGYDPTTGSLPEAPVAQPVAAPNGNGTADTDTATDADAGADTGADAAADAGGAVPAADAGDTATDAGAGASGTASDVDTAAGAAAATPPAPTTGTWVAVVTADRAYYDRNQVSEVQFPLGVPARSIELDGANPQAIGRRSRSRGTSPAIDLAGPPEDAAVSHTHASLLPTNTGGWELVDHGSTNGTYLNESPHPIGANEPIPIAPGDRIYVGAWTKITLELRPTP